MLFALCLRMQRALLTRFLVAPPYGRPPGFGGFPGAQPGAPPGMAPPPGMGMFAMETHLPRHNFYRLRNAHISPGAPPGTSSAPGVGAPPSLQQAQGQQPGRHGGLPANFQPPANMPNINFSAPVIRLGTSGPAKPATPATGGAGGRRDGAGDGSSGGSTRAGLGSGQGGVEQQRQHLRENMMALVPPTREEIARTIFVGKIDDGILEDDNIEAILRAAGSLRRWHRATDADGKKCSFGFAEYDDAPSLATAVEILKDVRIPKKQQETNGITDDENTGSDERKLLVSIRNLITGVSGANTRIGSR